MGNVERTVTLNRVAKYPNSVDTPDFGGAINVPNGLDQWDARGIVKPPPRQKIWRKWTAPVATLTDTYANLVGGLCGTVNSLPYKGFAAGDLCLVRASGSIVDDDRASFYFGWGLEYSVTDEPWGSHLVSYKGFEHVWAYYVRELVGPAGGKIMGVDPSLVYVDQVIPEGDHNLLGVP